MKRLALSMMVGALVVGTSTVSFAQNEKEGTVQLNSQPDGKKMGWIKAKRGHMALLPKGAAYQFRSAEPGVVLLQTIKGENTIERWAEICQTK